MESKYGITYVFVIADDYLITEYNDTAWDFAALIREKSGYGEDCIFAAVVVGPGERDYGVYTLGQGQMVMNDPYVEGMLDSLSVDLRNSDWDGALLTFIDLAEKMTVSYINDTDSVADRRGSTIYYKYDGGYSYDYDYDPNWNYRDHYTFIDFMPVGTVVAVCIIIGLTAAFIAMGIEWKKHRPVKKAVTADYYVKDENVKMSLVQDSFLRTRETRVRIHTDSGGGGGGRSGGSSFGGGSSGRSGGGGSRRF